MDDTKILNIPKFSTEIERKSKESGFTMLSDRHTGSLLKTLVSSKPQGNFLELGTGTGLSLSWMLDGMDKDSRVTTVDNNPELSAIAEMYFDGDKRATIVCQDGTEWIKGYTGEGFDVIFADAWPGKFSEIDEILDLIRIGGFYVVDDMNAAPDWPEGHQTKVDRLITYLEKREDFNLTKMNWSTGLVVAVKLKTC